MWISEAHFEISNTKHPFYGPCIHRGIISDAFAQYTVAQNHKLPLLCFDVHWFRKLIPNTEPWTKMRVVHCIEYQQILANLFFPILH